MEYEVLGMVSPVANKTRSYLQSQRCYKLAT
jgi:hypothetical protein